mmetsp:Transcript_13501/g.44068  ORF Transcript_13501/g.44068 Transcript_13501/m.44068 type:complete len:253 (+) Transcript_13501:172-930(+)
MRRARLCCGVSLRPSGLRSCVRLRRPTCPTRGRCVTSIPPRRARPAASTTINFSGAATPSLQSTCCGRAPAPWRRGRCARRPRTSSTTSCSSRSLAPPRPPRGTTTPHTGTWRASRSAPSGWRSTMCPPRAAYRTSRARTSTPCGTRSPTSPATPIRESTHIVQGLRASTRFRMSRLKLLQASASCCAGTSSLATRSSFTLRCCTAPQATRPTAAPGAAATPPAGAATTCTARFGRARWPTAGRAPDWMRGW